MNKKILLVLEVNGHPINMAPVKLWSYEINRKIEQWRGLYALKNHNYKIYYYMQSRMNKSIDKIGV